MKRQVVKSETIMAFYSSHKEFVFERIKFSKASIFSEFDFINVNGLSFLSVMCCNFSEYLLSEKRPVISSGRFFANAII